MVATGDHLNLVSGPEDFFDCAELDDDVVVNLQQESFDFSDGDDFLSMEAQYEEFIQLTEAEGNKFSSGMDGRVAKGTDTIKKNMIILKTVDTAAGTKTQPAKYAEKPAKVGSPKYSTCCIQQPR
ncbi:hypothetical protein SAY87_029313 [Trapa incisa]|uniref:Uncharacterized protein n=2 Tax=Trapa TaxID=22665 RepID=A0AAN7KM85_TRANT|nr:hypothetical protein SAY87_029313 [Trapa incisa]KAK4769230.1 hypothetical protein SAY86_027380 [Trapa natans]